MNSPSFKAFEPVCSYYGVGLCKHGFTGKDCPLGNKKPDSFEWVLEEGDNKDERG